jgi:putative membrane protein
MTVFMSGLTYGQFLALFLLPPITGLSILVLRDQRRSSTEKRRQGAGRWWLLAGLLVVALVYTIPWDSHLIANGVWFYDPSRVSGIALAGIPLEELLFFPLQTLLVGLWVFWLTPRLAPDRRGAPPGVRRVAVAAVGMAWLVALVLLLRGGRSVTYLGLELVWALPPLALQLGLGADLLWRRRRLALAALLPVVAYLAGVDALAIHAGIWVISPRLSLGALLGDLLPLEELVFFLLTSALVVGGLILGGDSAVRERLRLRARDPSQDRARDQSRDQSWDQSESVTRS